MFRTTFFLACFFIHSSMWGAFHTATEEIVPITIGDVCITMGDGEFIDKERRKWRLEGVGNILRAIDLELASNFSDYAMLQLNKIPVILSKDTTGTGNFFSELVPVDDDGDYALIGIKYYIPIFFLKTSTDLAFTELCLVRKISLSALRHYDKLPSIHSVELAYRAELRNFISRLPICREHRHPEINHSHAKVLVWSGIIIGIVFWLTVGRFILHVPLI